ncbi:MAG: ABC transporter ATP-binding protein [Candidatus Saccharimonadales bacterium]
MKSLNFAVPKYYWRQASRYPRYVAGVAIAIPLTVLINYFLPTLILANAFKKLTVNAYSTDQLWPVFGGQIILYFVLLVTGVLMWRLVDAFAWRLEGQVQRNMSEDVFDHLLLQSADFHANNFGGSLVSQNNKLQGGYVRTADTLIFQVYPMVIGVIYTNLLLGGRAPLFVLAFDVFAAIYIAVALRISQSVRHASSVFAASESKQTGFLADAITNVMTIKSYARGKYEHTRFNSATTTTLSDLRKFARAHRKQMNILGFLSRSISGMSLAMAIIAVIVFRADLGTMFLILSYTARLVEQLFDFSNTSLRNFARAWGDATDMVKILATKPSVVDPIDPVTDPIRDGSIVFEEVSFQHAGARDKLFDKLSFTIKHGEKVGVVGHSGSGKTTLTRLLLRFSDIQAGRIIIGGQDIAKITQDSLHSSVAYVPQEPLLFHRTIGENIGYGDESAAACDIVRAATDAHAAEFIDVLPHGYETLVGERGVKLSGGQRQRVAIARAMLTTAPLLVLDEATSALDSESEVLIQKALWKLMENRTAIVIAHRLSTIQKMDRIIVLDDGKIVEEGSHKQLLARDGAYAKLWAHQSGGFIEE